MEVVVFQADSFLSIVIDCALFSALYSFDVGI